MNAAGRPLGESRSALRATAPVTRPALQVALQQGAAELGLALTDAQIHQLLDYLRLLEKWGKVYNLTALHAPREMLTHHLLDSLGVIAPLRRHFAHSGHHSAARLLDVGSGAGLPGAVVAMCCPELSVDCVDAVAKKAAFIQQVAVSLRLHNLHGVHARVEKLKGEYDVVVSRAFASLADFTRLSANALAQGGAWLAMKGKQPTDEIAALSNKVQVFHVEQLEVPGLGAQRCLVWLHRGPANQPILAGAGPTGAFRLKLRK